MQSLAKRLLQVWPPALHWARGLRALARARRAGADPFLWFAPPGHYYSPLPGMPEAERVLGATPDPRAGLPGVDLREDAQRACWADLRKGFGRLGLAQGGSGGRSYPGDNPFFGWGEAHVAGALLLQAPPRRVVEVGSGFSSALLLDAAALVTGERVAFTFVDPDLSRLNALVRPELLRAHRVIAGLAQNQSMRLFQELEAGDWLFIDSSHVAKIGSDVLFLLFEVLPRLRPGVLVHIHDIYWPFEYPAAWYREGRAWNEAYLVRALLTGAGQWRIRFWNDWYWRAHRHDVERDFPALESLGGSLWLERVE